MASTVHNKTYYQKNREKIKAREREKGREIREYWLRRKYGITGEDWARIFEAQGCACAVCGAKEPGGRTGWHTEHDHADGRVRGILCFGCNVMLGMAGDSIDRLLDLANYLRGEG